VPVLMLDAAPVNRSLPLAVAGAQSAAATIAAG
jgi:hypothetical protein